VQGELKSSAAALIVGETYPNGAECEWVFEGASPRGGGESGGGERGGGEREEGELRDGGDSLAGEVAAGAGVGSAEAKGVPAEVEHARSGGGAFLRLSIEWDVEESFDFIEVSVKTRCQPRFPSLFPAFPHFLLSSPPPFLSSFLPSFG
jgi:hypothetical protein